MKKLIVCIVVALGLVGCGSIGNRVGKLGSSMKNGDFKVTLYSGGQVVKSWDVNGYINTEQQSDGYYWYSNGKIVRVSGDVVIEEK